MQKYTAFSPHAMKALKDAKASSGEKFSFELNDREFNRLVSVLLAAATNDPVTEEDSEWAGDFLSSMAERLGIEFV